MDIDPRFITKRYVWSGILNFDLYLDEFSSAYYEHLGQLFQASLA